jgi:hypothetical protein
MIEMFHQSTWKRLQNPSRLYSTLADCMPEEFA